MKLTHYSVNRIPPIFDRVQIGQSDKPSGLWVSDEDEYGWAEWCVNNSPDFIAEYRHEITLADDANILYLRTPEDIDAFTECYRGDNLRQTGCIFFIDWPQVAREYDGIIITPYQWTRRLMPSTRWYYGWDCASGCIWAKKAIKSFSVG